MVGHRAMKRHLARYSTQKGGNYVVYSGARRQRGGSLFSSFKSTMAPIGRGLSSGAKMAGQQLMKGAKVAGRQMWKGAKYAAKNKAVREIGKHAMQKGAEIAASAAVDAIQGRNLGTALKERSREVALNTLTGSSNNTDRPRKRIKLKQKGNAPKKRRINPPASYSPASSNKKVVVVRRYKKRPKRLNNKNRKGRFSRAVLNRNNLF